MRWVWSLALSFTAKHAISWFLNDSKPRKGEFWFTHKGLVLFKNSTFSCNNRSDWWLSCRDCPDCAVGHKRIDQSSAFSHFSRKLFLYYCCQFYNRRSLFLHSRNKTPWRFASDALSRRLFCSRKQCGFVQVVLHGETLLAIGPSTFVAKIKCWCQLNNSVATCAIGLSELASRCSRRAWHIGSHYSYVDKVFVRETCAMRVVVHSWCQFGLVVWCGFRVLFLFLWYILVSSILPFFNHATHICCAATRHQ